MGWKRRSDCTCTWMRVAPPPADVPVMSVRDEACPQHGDDTDWWARTQEHARSLGGHIGRDAASG